MWRTVLEFCRHDVSLKEHWYFPQMLVMRPRCRQPAIETAFHPDMMAVTLTIIQFILSKLLWHFDVGCSTSALAMPKLSRHLQQQKVIPSVGISYRCIVAHMIFQANHLGALLPWSKQAGRIKTSSMPANNEGLVQGCIKSLSQQDYSFLKTGCPRTGRPVKFKCSNLDFSPESHSCSAQASVYHTKTLLQLQNLPSQAETLPVVTRALQPFDGPASCHLADTLVAERTAVSMILISKVQSLPLEMFTGIHDLPLCCLSHRNCSLMICEWLHCNGGHAE